MYPANTLQAECYRLSLTSTTGRTSRILLADVIPWINKATQRANPMFRSCMVLLSSSPVIENCQCQG